MTVTEYMKKTYSQNTYSVRERAACVDGFEVSIQGGTAGHYCIPREHCNEYEAVELGYPNRVEESLIEYAESPETPLDSVYGFVPIEVVERIVEKHGGIDYEKSLMQNMS